MTEITDPKKAKDETCSGITPEAPVPEADKTTYQVGGFTVNAALYAHHHRQTHTAKKPGETFAERQIFKEQSGTNLFR